MAVEGPSDRAVLEEICKRDGHVARALSADGKSSLFQRFDKMLRTLELAFRPTHFLVVVDLRSELDCTLSAGRWKEAVRSRFPRAEVCVCVWELEAWLLADPKAVADELGLDKPPAPWADKVGLPGPYEHLEELYRKKLGINRGSAYNKEADGMAIARRLDLDRARKSSHSLAHFLKIVRSGQTQLPH